MDQSLRGFLTELERSGRLRRISDPLYHRPGTIDDLVEHTAGRILDQFGIETGRVRRWQGA